MIPVNGRIRVGRIRVGGRFAPRNTRIRSIVVLTARRDNQRKNKNPFTNPLLDTFASGVASLLENSLKLDMLIDRETRKAWDLYSV